MDVWRDRVKEKVVNKIKSLKNAKQIYDTFPVLQDEELKQCLKDLVTFFFIVPIEKVSNNIFFYL